MALRGDCLHFSRETIVPHPPKIDFYAHQYDHTEPVLLHLVPRGADPTKVHVQMWYRCRDRRGGVKVVTLYKSISLAELPDPVKVEHLAPGYYQLYVRLVACPLSAHPKLDAAIHTYNFVVT